MSNWVTPQARRDLAAILGWLLAWSVPALELAAMLAWSVPLAVTGAAVSGVSAQLREYGRR